MPPVIDEVVRKITAYFVSLQSKSDNQGCSCKREETTEGNRIVVASSSENPRIIDINLILCCGQLRARRLSGEHRLHTLKMKRLELKTPAFVYIESELIDSHRRVRCESSGSDCYLLYTLKPCAEASVLEIVSEHATGFVVSSLFDAKLARESLAAGSSLHVTSPAFRPDDIDEILDLCDYISFNSLSQWARYREIARGRASCGLRINPQCSFVEDARHDPCRPHSKLGIALDDLVKVFEETPGELSGISGLHFHNNSESEDFGELLKTVQHIETKLGKRLSELQWINVGGGYLFEDLSTLPALKEAIDLLRSYELQVFMEPGAAFVQKAGYLISSVLDILKSDGKNVAILDTTVNHLPEVFEYQYTPDVQGHREGAPHEYILAGCSCLAGDLFGEYAFDEELQVGSRVVFENVGAYSTVKWHTFNGINLPSIYVLTKDGELILQKEFTYEDYASKCRGSAHEITST